jgi:hypothetical protein
MCLMRAMGRGYMRGGGAVDRRRSGMMISGCARLGMMRRDVMSRVDEWVDCLSVIRLASSLGGTGLLRWW